MKKRGIYGSVLSVLLLLTSCMGDSNNMITYHRVGVVREKPMRCIYTNDDKGNPFIVSSADFETKADAKEGDCCLIDFKTNFSEDLGGGVYKAEMQQYVPVPAWSVSSTQTDTSKILVNERLITLNFKKSVYLDGYFFVQSVHAIHQEDQKDIYDLSYDPKQTVHKEEDGTRIYNLFLRVTQEGGTGDSTRYIATNAFKIDQFLQVAKAAEIEAGQSSVNFRINHALRYNSDTTACVWGSTDVFKLSFTKEGS